MLVYRVMSSARSAAPRAFADRLMAVTPPSATRMARPPVVQCLARPLPARFHNRLPPALLLSTSALPRHPAGGARLHASSSLQQQQPAAGLGLGPAEEGDPLIVLVGWLGAKPQYLAKYEQLWEQRLGCEVLSTRPSVLTILLPPLAHARAARFARQLQERLQWQPHRPVVFHVMSNGGFIFTALTMRYLEALGKGPYSPPSPSSPDGTPVTASLVAASPGLAATSGAAAASQQGSASAQALGSSTSGGPVSGDGGAGGSGGGGGLRADEGEGGLDRGGQQQQLARLPPGTCGIIFDSAPAVVDATVAARGVLSAALGRSFEDTAARHPGLVSALKALFVLLLRLPLLASNLQLAYAVWGGVDPRVPQLYLYSDVDAIIPAHQVRKFMRGQAERGVDARCHEWGDTPHCEHYRLYPQQYAQLLRGFLQDVLPPRAQGRAPRSANSGSSSSVSSGTGSGLGSASNGSSVSARGGNQPSESGGLPSRAVTAMHAAACELQGGKGVASEPKHWGWHTNETPMPA